METGAVPVGHLFLHGLGGLRVCFAPSCETETWTQPKYDRKLEAFNCFQ